MRIVERMARGFGATLVFSTVVLLAAIGHGVPKGAFSIEVTTLDDVVDGDVSSGANLLSTPGDDGKISLREALTAGINTESVDGVAITFLSAGDYIVTSELPEIGGNIGPIQVLGEDKLTLLNGSGISGINGFTVTSANNLISGATIAGFQAGVRIYGEGATGNAVTNCILGATETVVVKGDGATGNAYGVMIDDGATQNVVGGTAIGDMNVISGNSNAGVLLAGGATLNELHNNYIGTDESGTEAVPNFVGVLIDGASNNTVGSEVGASTNLIAGNTTSGIEIQGAATGNMIFNNQIGTGTSGSLGAPNGQGIRIDGTGGAGGTQIGSTSFVSGNVISGNSFAGIALLDTDNNTILKNTIGGFQG